MNSLRDDHAQSLQESDMQCAVFPSTSGLITTLFYPGHSSISSPHSPPSCPGLLVGIGGTLKVRKKTELEVII